MQAYQEGDVLKESTVTKEALGYFKVQGGSWHLGRCSACFQTLAPPLSSNCQPAMAPFSFFSLYSAQGFGHLEAVGGVDLPWRSSG